MRAWEQLTYSILPLLGVAFDLRKPIRDIAAFHRLGLSQHRFRELIFLLFRHEQHVLEFLSHHLSWVFTHSRDKELTLTTFSVLMSSCASFFETLRRQLFSPFVFRSANRSAIEPLLAIEFDICGENVFCCRRSRLELRFLQRSRVRAKCHSPFNSNPINFVQTFVNVI